MAIEVIKSELLAMGIGKLGSVLVIVDNTLVELDLNKISEK